MGGPQQGGGGEGGGNWMGLLMFPAIIAIFYFLIIRPQNKKQKETQKMLSTIKKGDRIVTIGGIHGIIQSVKTNTVIVKVDDNVKLEFNRSAISSIEQPGKEDKEDKDEKDESETDVKDSEKTEESESDVKDEKKPEPPAKKKIPFRTIIPLVILVIVILVMVLQRSCAQKDEDKTGFINNGKKHTLVSK